MGLCGVTTPEGSGSCRESREALIRTVPGSPGSSVGGLGTPSPGGAECTGSTGRRRVLGHEDWWSGLWVVVGGHGTGVKCTCVGTDYVRGSGKESVVSTHRGRDESVVVGLPSSKDLPPPPVRPGKDPGTGVGRGVCVCVLLVCGRCVCVCCVYGVLCVWCVNTDTYLESKLTTLGLLQWWLQGTKEVPTSTTGLSTHRDRGRVEWVSSRTRPSRTETKGSPSPS